MAGLIEWNPLREIDEIARRLSPLLFKEKSPPPSESSTGSLWSPDTDILENEDAFLIKIEVPEVSKEALRVVVENGVIFLSGYRFRSSDQKGSRYHRTERYCGDFTRSFSLPENADPSKITATLKDGVLTVRIGKRGDSQKTSLEVPVE